MFESGIQTERSDRRIHVSYTAMSIYVYRTTDGVRALERWAETNALKGATQGIHKTSRGHPVPWRLIVSCLEYRIPPDIMAIEYVEKNEDESVKGRSAENIVLEMMKRNGGAGELVKDRALQIAGIDIRRNGVGYQVKCDWSGGGIAGQDECTGNLFLQTHEWNPYRKH